MEKLVFKAKGRTCSNIIRITDEAAVIIDEIIETTGLPTQQIVSQMIKFCEDKWEAK